MCTCVPAHACMCVVGRDSVPQVHSLPGTVRALCPCGGSPTGVGAVSDRLRGLTCVRPRGVGLGGRREESVSPRGAGATAPPLCCRRDPRLRDTLSTGLLLMALVLPLLHPSSLLTGTPPSPRDRLCSQRLPSSAPRAVLRFPSCMESTPGLVLLCLSRREVGKLEEGGGGVRCCLALSSGPAWPAGKVRGEGGRSSMPGPHGGGLTSFSPLRAVHV